MILTPDLVRDFKRILNGFKSCGLKASWPFISLVYVQIVCVTLLLFAGILFGEFCDRCKLTKINICKHKFVYSSPCILRPLIQPEKILS